jgi:hypothetical protein
MLLSHIGFVDMEPANPVIEPGAKGREHRTRGPEERLDFMWRQLDPECQTGPGRIQEELVPKILVREQSAQGPLHVPLTHHILLFVLYRHGRALSTRRANLNSLKIQTHVRIG